MLQILILMTHVAGLFVFLVRLVTLSFSDLSIGNRVLFAKSTSDVVEVCLLRDINELRENRWTCDVF